MTRQRVGAWLVLALVTGLVPACGRSGDDVATTPGPSATTTTVARPAADACAVTPAPTASVSATSLGLSSADCSTTTPPPSSVTSTTTTITLPPATATSAPPEDLLPIWVVSRRRAGSGSVLEFHDVVSGESWELPLDRRFPQVGWVAGDLQGGFWFHGGPASDQLQRLPAGASAPVAHAVAGTAAPQLVAVADVDGAPALLSITTDSVWDRDATAEWTESHTELSIERASGETTILAAGDTTWRFEAGRNITTGSAPIDADYGDGLLAILWHVAEAPNRLELWKRLDASAVRVVGPDMSGGNPPGDVAILDVALSDDGAILFALMFPALEPSRGGPDLVAWDVRTGEEIDRLVGTMFFVHDGDRVVAGDRSVDGGAIEPFVARLTGGGFVEYEVPPLKTPPLGVVSGRLVVGADAGLTFSVPWPSCSLEGVARQADLPDAVAATRDAIAAAARQCDLLALFDIAAASDGFRYVDADFACGEPWRASIDDADPVPVWYRGFEIDGEAEAILDALRAEHHRLGDSFVWEGEHGYRIEIGADGAWLLDWRAFPVEPCESIMCTC